MTQWTNVSFIPEYTMDMDKQVWWRRILKRPVPVAIGGSFLAQKNDGTVMTSTDAMIWTETTPELKEGPK